jgi:zinc transport system permease protein
MDIFQYTFFQNALIGILIVSIISAMIGTYIVTRRLVFISGGITHACFGGLGLGYFLGISPILMAGVFAVASSLGVEWLAGKQHVREDSAIAVVWALGMAIGTLFIFLTPGYVPELNSFLFGDILTITRTDILAFVIFMAIFLFFFIAFYRAIVACAFDRDFAHTKGIPVVAINAAMTVLIAICIVLTIRLIGIMLLMSLFTLPQMIAEIFVHRLRPMMVLSVAVSLLCAITGLFVSYFAGVPASAIIVLALTFAYALCRTLKALSRHSSRTCR